MRQKFYSNVFGSLGDLTAIPDPSQVSGSVSFQNGWTFDYQRQIGVDPLAKPIDRQTMNYLFNTITAQLQQYQEFGVPEWITSADNGGTPFAYDFGAVVRYSVSGNPPFTTYVSIVDGQGTNTSTPGTDANWQPLRLAPGNYYNDTGVVNAYVVATDPATAHYSNGQKLSFKAINANTGPSTLDAGGGVVALKTNQGVALAGGDITAGSIVNVVYDSTTSTFWINNLVYSQVPIGNILSYGANGNGTSDNTTALTLAIAAGIPLYVPAGAYKVNSNLNFTSQITMAPGAYFVIPTGVTLTFSRVFSAGFQQCFSCTGTGTIIFTKTATAYPIWWGAAGDNTTDDSAVLQNALNSGANVDGLFLSYKINSSITIPAGKILTSAALTAGTANMNMVLVNTGSRFIKSKIVGTGTTTLVERGVYPAADGVTDVELDLEVTNISFGIHAEYITTAIDANFPKRWHGYLYVHDIVGTAGYSNGYGLLLSPASDCNFTVEAKNMARHAVYLSAGASRNNIVANVDGSANYAVQIYSTAGQTASNFNNVRINARNLTDNTGVSGALAIIGLANFNRCVVNMIGDGNSKCAVHVEGSSGGPYPLGNEIVDGNITGQFTSADVIELLNADSTVVARNHIDAYATYDVIGSRISGTNGSTHGGIIKDNKINPGGNNCIGIYSEVTTVPTHIGENQIDNTGTSLRVSDNTSGKRTGFSRSAVLSGTTASINATTTGDTTVALPIAIATARSRLAAYLTGASVQFFDKPFDLCQLGRPDETHVNIRIYNGHSAAQTFNYEGTIFGD